MKIIKLVMSKGDSISLPEEKAEAVIDSDAQIVKITDKDGKWTGETLNKSYLVSTMVDVDATKELVKELRMLENSQQLPAPENKEQIKKLIEEYRPNFLAK